MHSLPQISIVTPSFNQAEFLDECIDSVLSQNYPNLEYIIMDGGSTDGSVEIIKKYERHLTYWQSKSDGGQYSAISDGFKKTSGIIMTWLNSDDKLHHGALKTVGGVFKYFKHVDWITGRPTSWDENGFLSYVSNVLPQWSLEKCLNRQADDAFIQQESTFWRRTLWERSGSRFYPKLEFAADFELWTRFFRHANLYTVDALLGGFRFHSGQKTANFMDKYLQEVANVICAAKENDVMGFSSQAKSEQLIIPRQSLLDLKIMDCCDIPIATSIAPATMDLQRTAIRSWQQLGFKVISVNSAEEIAELHDAFPGVSFVEAFRNACAETGRPLIYLDDVFSALQSTGSQICGIINSDIILCCDSGLVDFILKTVGDGMLFGSRIDLDSMAIKDGEKFIYGFDYFFFNKEVLKMFPKSDFCLGMPWWDYWAPFVPLVKGVPCRELISPVAFHIKHETKWAGGLFRKYGRIFSDKIRQVTQQPDIAYTITNESSQEQLNVFSFNVLQYILKNSDKVLYPDPYGGARKIEVGRLQYLKMREQVIEHHRRVWELIEQVRLANSAVVSCCHEVNAIRESSSWRITKPLRLMFDWLRRVKTAF